jgi:hypothetical protein
LPSAYQRRRIEMNREVGGQWTTDLLLDIIWRKIVRGKKINYIDCWRI